MWAPLSVLHLLPNWRGRAHSLTLLMFGLSGNSGLSSRLGDSRLILHYVLLPTFWRRKDLTLEARLHSLLLSSVDTDAGLASDANRSFCSILTASIAVAFMLKYTLC